MTSLHDYGGLLLASRLKKVSEALSTGVDDIYRRHGVTLPSRCFPILFLLRDNGPLGITELADRLGQSHPAVSQMSRKLLRHGVVREQAHAGDNRRRLLVLAPKGAAMMKRMGPVWTAISAAVDQLNTTTHVDFVAAVTTLDGALGDRPFARRIDASLRHRDARHVAIIPFESRYAADFKRLNVEWLEKYFTVEPIDEKVLSHPEAAILRPGGRIFLARFKREIVGTSALIKAGRGRYELSKMAVTERLPRPAYRPASVDGRHRRIPPHEGPRALSRIQQRADARPASVRREWLRPRAETGWIVALQAKRRIHGVPAGRFIPLIPGTPVSAPGCAFRHHSAPISQERADARSDSLR